MSQTHATVGDLLELGFTVEGSRSGYKHCRRLLSEFGDTQFYLEASLRETGYMYDACIAAYHNGRCANSDLAIVDRTREGFVKLLSCLAYPPHSSQTPSDPSRGE